MWTERPSSKADHPLVHVSRPFEIFRCLVVFVSQKVILLPIKIWYFETYFQYYISTDVCWNELFLNSAFISIYILLSFKFPIWHVNLYSQGWYHNIYWNLWWSVQVMFQCKPFLGRQTLKPLSASNNYVISKISPNA